MRIISPKRITEAMLIYPQWKVGLKLWLDVFNNKSINFESSIQIRNIWKNKSGWNVDRIPANKLKPETKKGPLDIYIFDVHKAKIFLQFEPIIEDLTQLLKACNSPITSDTELEVRMKIIDELFSYAKTEDDLPALFAHMITDRVYEYEQKNLNIPTVKPSEALAFFMQERKIKQKDLSEIAPQNVISEILNEKRKMTVEQIKGFANFFGVPETTFLG